jgi:histone H3/H4
MPELQISTEAIEKLNKWNEVIARRLVKNSEIIVQTQRLQTIDPRSIQASVRVTLPEGIQQAPISEATRALTFSVQKGAERERKTKTERAGLIFPVARFDNFIRMNTSYRVGKLTGVYLTGIMEQLTFDVIDVAGERVRNDGRKRIMDKDIDYAVETDEDIGKLTKCV